MFPRLSERIDLPADGLSEGEQQMCAWGWAHSLAPTVDGGRVVPWCGSHRVEAIYKAVSRVRERGMTVLIVEPDVLVALEQADRGYVLDVEHITMTGSA